MDMVNINPEADRRDGFEGDPKFLIWWGHGTFALLTYVSRLWMHKIYRIFIPADSGVVGATARLRLKDDWRPIQTTPVYASQRNPDSLKYAEVSVPPWKYDDIEIKLYCTPQCGPGDELIEFRRIFPRIGLEELGTYLQETIKTAEGRIFVMRIEELEDQLQKIGIEI
jgi:hypothetical protein